MTNGFLTADAWVKIGQLAVAMILVRLVVLVICRVIRGLSCRGRR